MQLVQERGKLAIFFRSRTPTFNDKPVADQAVRNPFVVFSLRQESLVMFMDPVLAPAGDFFLSIETPTSISPESLMNLAGTPILVLSSVVPTWHRSTD